jgi:hypothetical protein
VGPGALDLDAIEPDTRGSAAVEPDVGLEA